MPLPISKVAKAIAGLGVIASMPTIMGRQFKQAMVDAAHMERIYCTLRFLGIPGEDVQRHNEVVRKLARTSAIFSNRAVELAGMNLATRRVARDDPIIPEDPCQWARELWDEVISGNCLDIERTVSNLYGCGIRFSDYVMACDALEMWLAEAEQLWGKR